MTDSTLNLQQCVFAKWSPVIGDPSVVGWLTTLAYAITGVVCFVAAVRGERDRRFWALATFLMLLLGLNKELDLQSALTALGRCHAKIYGWYEHRRPIQIAVITTIAGATLLAVPVLALLLRKSLNRIWPALLGLMMITSYVAIRAVGFHRMDRFIGSRIGALKWNWILELGGISIVLIWALWTLAKPAKNDSGGPQRDRRHHAVPNDQVEPSDPGA